MHTDQILRGLRREADVSQMIKQDAGALTERVISRAGPAGMFEEIGRFLTDTYRDAGAMLALEHHLRVSAQLDGATARSHWRALWGLLDQLGRAETLSPQWRDSISAALAEHAEPTFPEDDPE